MSLFFINSLSAQESIEENAAVRTALDEMFENLNKGRIITGFLQDYAVDLVDFHNYDGVLLTDSNYVDANTFVDILKSVKSSSVRDQSALFSNLPSVMNDFSALKVADTLNVAFMPFATTYKYTVVTADQTVYYVKSDGTYEIDNPSASFGVKYLSTGYSADDNILYTQGMVKKYLKGNNCYLAYPVADGWGYWTGVRSGFGYQWTFDFFDSSMYTDKLQSALSCACGEEHLMDPFELVICNSQQEPMQRLPFAIICKPTFPGN